jgi:hypothetical protein
VEVFPADGKLGRRVAIKVLAPDKVADAERKSRFTQEANGASGLNDPAIVTGMASAGRWPSRSSSWGIAGRRILSSTPALP